MEHHSSTQTLETRVGQCANVIAQEWGFSVYFADAEQTSVFVDIPNDGEYTMWSNTIDSIASDYGLTTRQNDGGLIVFQK